MSNRERIFRYARRYATRRSADPTFREAAKALRLTLDEVEDACEDAQGYGMNLSVTVAIGIPGVGCGGEEPRHAWGIETWED